MVKVNVLGTKMLLRILRAPRFKKPFTVATPPPWDKTREHKAGLSEAQLKVIDAFTTVASRTAGIPLSQRMEIIKAVLSGKSFGGAKRVRYPKKPEAEIKRLIEELKALV